MTSKRRYKRMDLTVRSSEGRIRKKSRTTRTYILRYKRFSKKLQNDINKNNYEKDSADHYISTTTQLLDLLEEIKTLSRRLSYQQSNEIRDVISWCIEYRIFSNIETAHDIKSRLKNILNDRLQSLKEEKINERRLRRGRPPRGTFTKRSFMSTGRMSREGKKEGREIGSIEKQKDEAYRQLENMDTGDIDYEQIGKSLTNFVEAIEDESQMIKDENEDAEIQEDQIDEDLKWFKEKIENSKKLSEDWNNLVKEIEKIQEKYRDLTTTDLKEARKMSSELSGDLKEEKREIGSSKENKKYRGPGEYMDRNHEVRKEFKKDTYDRLKKLSNEIDEEAFDEVLETLRGYPDNYHLSIVQDLIVVWNNVKNQQKFKGTAKALSNKTKEINSSINEAQKKENIHVAYELMRGLVEIAKVPDQLGDAIDAIGKFDNKRAVAQLARVLGKIALDNPKELKNKINQIKGLSQEQAINLINNSNTSTMKKAA